MKISAFIGYDFRWPLAYGVTVRSLMQYAPGINITPLLLPHFQALGIYDRPMHIHKNQMHDVISDAPMATEFAISRFFIPYLAQYQGWSLFCDSDFLFRADLSGLFDLIDPEKAVMCVQHSYTPPETTKMDGQAQTLYRRKNWSSLMLINNEHPANRILEPSLLNQLPGRDLHAFNWLEDSQIGALPSEWNWLEGHSADAINAKAVHFTRGTPDMPGYEHVRYADEWRDVAKTINLCKVK